MLHAVRFDDRQGSGHPGVGVEQRDDEHHSYRYADYRDHKSFRLPLHDIVKSFIG